MNPEECLHHPLNNSNAKFSYKFGKADRFNNPKLYTHSMYNVLSNKKHRAAGFGYGERVKLYKTHNNPSPDKYSLPSSINKSGKSFGMGRDSVKFRHFLHTAQKSRELPSPDKYNIASGIKKRSISFGERLPTYIDMAQKNDVPPPNTYNLDKVSVNLQGKYPSSKIKNVRRIIFLGRQSFYDPSSKYNVGPGQYEIRAKTESSVQLRKTSKSFGTSKRPQPADKSKLLFPGPGMYSTFSEFPQSTI